MLCAAAEQSAPWPKGDRPRFGNPVGETIALYARAIEPVIDAAAARYKAETVLELIGALFIYAGHVEIGNALRGFSTKFIRQDNGQRTPCCCR